MSKDICAEFGTNYIDVIDNKLIKSNGIESSNKFSNVNIAIAAAVTGYARIYMHKIKLDILARGNKIIYMDTDSIVTDSCLPKELVGTNLGQFKLEHKASKGYFISSKQRS